MDMIIKGQMLYSAPTKKSDPDDPRVLTVIGETETFAKFSILSPFLLNEGKVDRTDRLYKVSGAKFSKDGALIFADVITNIKA